MRFIKGALFCICFAVVFAAQTNVCAAYDIKNAAPSIVFEDSFLYPIESVDKEKEESKIIVYTRNYGEFTGPFAADTHEFIVVNNIIVHKSNGGSRGTYIPSNGCVISYTGNDTDFLDRFRIGGELKFLNIDIPFYPDMYFVLDDLMVPIDKINALRGANETILYNPYYGTTTNTNPWGMELTVENNIITKLSDMSSDEGTNPKNNSSIPTEGMVISIHSGSPYYRQVHEKAKLGDSIAVYDDSSLLFSAAKIKYAALNPRSLEDNPAAWDAKEGKVYDGFRGPNQLIIYDESYDEHTGTNPYGYEVAVNSSGNIISAGGNNSKIPEGGYILSGHGDSSKWLERYANLGAAVVISTEKKEAAIIHTPDTYIRRAAYSIKSAEDRLDMARLKLLDIPYDDIQSAIGIAKHKLQKIQMQLDNGEYEGLINTVKIIQKEAEDAYFMAFESAKAENRAVWLRPRDTGIDEIRDRLDMLKSININTVYLETYWNGYSIYPTDNEIIQQNPMFKGFDVLSAYIKEAHLRNIEIHAWVENFLAGLPIAEKKPEWMAVSRKGEPYYLENGKTKYYFMNPALPEVREFLSDLYKELVKKYELDGIQFDYLRYSNSDDYTNDSGYDTYTRQLFMNYTGADPISLKPGDPLWQKWCEYRTFIISSYACRVFSEMKSMRPEIRISADVWPDYDKTLTDIYQDPKSWTKNDYIDILIPMSYYLSEGQVVEDLLNTWAFAKGHSHVNSGIATFTKVDAKVLIRQIEAIRATSTNGIAVFECESLFNGGYDDALKLGAFSTPSMPINRDPEESARTVIREIIRKIDDIYVINNGMSNEQAVKYKKLFEGIEAECKEDKANSAYSIKNAMREALQTLNSDEYLNEEIMMQIRISLNCAINIIDAYISDIRFMENHKVKQFQAELPFKDIKINEEIPVKVRAVFDDNTVMYLDKTQYEIKSDNPDNAEIIDNRLIIKKGKAGAKITINVLDSFSFNNVKGSERKVELTIDQRGNAMTGSPDQGILKASETGCGNVSL